MASAYAASEGLEIGYGLNNSTTVWGNWVFHGHGGAVPGALANMLYLPNEGVGYALMINCENQDAMNQLEDVVRTYVLRGQKPPPLPVEIKADPAQSAEYSGWYEPITPRNESSQYLERFLGLTRLHFENGRLCTWDLTNGKRAYIRVVGRIYRRLDNAAPNLALVSDRSDGTLFQFGGGPTFRRVPGLIMSLGLGAALAAALLMLGSVIFAFFWVPRMLFGGRKVVPHFRVLADLLMATLSAIAVFVLIWEASGDYYARPGGPLWSGNFVGIAFNVANVAFVSFAVGGLIRTLNSRRSPMPWLVWWHSFALALVLAVCATYLAYWGLRAEFAL